MTIDELVIISKKDLEELQTTCNNALQQVGETKARIEGVEKNFGNYTGMNSVIEKLNKLENICKTQENKISEQQDRIEKLEYEKEMYQGIVEGHEARIVSLEIENKTKIADDTTSDTK